MPNESARYEFTAADAARALGMPDHAPNGTPVLGAALEMSDDLGGGANLALNNALERLNDLAQYHRREAQTLSTPLQEAIRLERAGLPTGRTDVNPTQVPALGYAPEGFTMARSVSVPLDGGMARGPDVAEAWAQVRESVAKADPPFPAVLKGYTFEPVYGDDSISGPSEATLTVYG